MEENRKPGLLFNHVTVITQSIVTVSPSCCCNLTCMVTHYHNQNIFIENNTCLPDKIIPYKFSSEAHDHNVASISCGILESEYTRWFVLKTAHQTFPLWFEFCINMGNSLLIKRAEA